MVSEGVGGMSVLIPYYGIRGCVQKYLSDVGTRACARLRMVYVGSKDASGANDVVSRCMTASPHFRIVRGPGANCKSSVGGKLRVYSNSCVKVMRSSS